MKMLPRTRECRCKRSRIMLAAAFVNVIAATYRCGGTEGRTLSISSTIECVLPEPGPAMTSLGLIRFFAIRLPLEKREGVSNIPWNVQSPWLPRLFTRRVCFFSHYCGEGESK